VPGFRQLDDRDGSSRSSQEFRFMSYRAPIKDILFVMKELAGIEAVAALPGHEDAGLETATAVLEECARFTEGVLAPLNREGDRNPSSFKDGAVTTTPGFKRAFRQFAEGGWQGLQHPVDFGGQGLPKLIHAACSEMVNSANLSFALCPLLTAGTAGDLHPQDDRRQLDRFHEPHRAAGRL
jgi:3-(methylthio)propanoyl-CoA dehydrogenase